MISDVRTVHTDGTPPDVIAEQFQRQDSPLFQTRSLHRPSSGMTAAAPLVLQAGTNGPE